MNPDIPKATALTSQRSRQSVFRLQSAQNLIATQAVRNCSCHKEVLRTQSGTFRGLPASNRSYSMLTKKGKYGLKALIYLARIPVGQLAFVNDIAVANNIPKKFLDAILGELRNAGFVLSRKGKDGGYRLAKPASEIKIGHVIRVLDGPLAPVACASRTQYERCEDCDEHVCQVRHIMLQVRQAMSDVLDNRSLASMRDSANDDLPRIIKLDA